MFAVPGWAVSADSLVQEASRPAKSNARTNIGEDASESKKRKHPHHGDEKSRKIGGGELERLWNQNFGGASLGAGVKQDKLRREDTQRSNVPKLLKPRADSRGQTGTYVHGGVQDQTQENKSQPPGIGMANYSDKRAKHEAKREKQVDSTTASISVASLLPPQPPPAVTAKLTPLQAKMRNKLTSARFRHLNQTLYTTSSNEALDLFTNSPDLFAEYHAGFSQQVQESWPQNPVDGYVHAIKTRGRLDDRAITAGQAILPLPRRKTGSCTIADLGCGDAPLARGCQSQVKTLKLKFHNFDLHTPNTHVTKADISNLPLRDGEADIAVFCLSLMGTNWISFVEEAWRILRGDGKGEVWVAEVKSRFGRSSKGRVVENSVGKKRKQKQKKGNDDEDQGAAAFAEEIDEGADETDISAFVNVFRRRGFALKEDSINKRNKMFVSMVFFKSGVPTAGKHRGMKWNGHEYQRQQEAKTKFASSTDGEEVSPEEEAKVLKPCVYKTR